MTESLLPNQNRDIFSKAFDCGGILVKPSAEPQLESEFPIERLDRDTLQPADQTVRDVENDFAPIFDTVQFTTPGMRDMTVVDTDLFNRWIGNPQGKTVLEIGPGTGRITLPLADAVEPGGKVVAIETGEKYLTELIKKAAAGGINPDSLKLAVADMQTVEEDLLRNFLEGRQVDNVVIWFGPLTQMTTDPQRVMRLAESVLKPGGSLLLTTNALDGIAYRLPEQRIREGANPNLPLGYQPSIFTRRSQSEGAQEPNGMILGDGSILPAKYWGVEGLKGLITESDLQIVDMQGITRLMGLFPADLKDDEALRKFIDIVGEIEPEAARRMKSPFAILGGEIGWAKAFDQRLSRDPAKLSQFNYTAVKAVKLK